MADGKCPVCGAPLKNNACEYCGYTATVQQPQAQRVQPQVVINNVQQTTVGVNPMYVVGISSKSKWTAFILCFFLGWLGVHKFYVGKVGMGILYLFTCGLFGFGWLIDLILIACGSFKDSAGLPLKK